MVLQKKMKKIIKSSKKVISQKSNRVIAIVKPIPKKFDKKD